MHANNVGKRVLAVATGEPVLPDRLPEFGLQGSAFHRATVRSRHFYIYALTCSLYVWVARDHEMGLRLVYDDLDLSLDLPGTPGIAEAVGMQIERCLVPGTASGFALRVAGQLMGMLDADLQPPSPQQMAIATLTARAFNLSIPSDALRYRGSMAEFLDRYRPLLDVTDSTRRPRRRPDPSP